MRIASHNSWSYATPSKFWMKLIKFTAKCQAVDIKTQYENYGVRDFDLRVRFNKKGKLVIVHGYITYAITKCALFNTLRFLNKQGDCSIRVLLDIRNKKQFEENINVIEEFRTFCSTLTNTFKNIKFWGGVDIYTNISRYRFDYNPTTEHYYSSVRKPNIIDDWYPWLYAKFNNRKVIRMTHEADIVFIDFVNIR